MGEPGAVLARVPRSNRSSRYSGVAAADGHRFGEREERPGLVSRFGETVGVKQDRVTALPGHGEGRALVGGEQAQAEGETIGCRSQELWPVLAEQQRLEVAAVEHRQLAAILADFASAETKTGLTVTSHPKSRLLADTSSFAASAHASALLPTTLTRCSYILTSIPELLSDETCTSIPATHESMH